MDKNIQGNTEQLNSSKRKFSEAYELNEETGEIVEVNVDQESGDGPPKKKKKRNSWIWNHFNCRISEIDNREYAHCNYCNS